MENTIYAGLSRQMALRRQMEVVANNIANMSTAGYRSEQMLFVEYMNEPDGPGYGNDDAVAMVLDQGTVRDMRPGPMVRTDNPFDVAIEGRGYLVVETPAGPRYTRNGHLSLDVDRRLVDGSGLPVLGTGDQPITVPQNAGDVSISANGDVSADGQIVGSIRLVEFDDELRMVPLGGGLYVTNQMPADSADTELRQGFIEQSNVLPIVEMTRMIEVSRSYQSTSRLLNDEHERQRQTIRRFGQMMTA